MPQHGFFFDQSRCTACHTCAVACKDWNDIRPGPVKWLRVFEWEKGVLPNVRINTLFAPCYHCEKPACVNACPTQAIYKEEKYGAVLIDEEKCNGCRLCSVECPYGSIQFAGEEPGTKASKCNMCIDKLEQGENPVCVMACQMRALDFDTMENLTKKYGNNRDMEDMPSSSLTEPSVVFKPKDIKKQYVPYDANKALQLLARRDPLPPVFGSPSDVTEVPEGLVGRAKLVMKLRNIEELMQTTRNDEG